jgi:AraC family transcriptional regulator of adaptative response/methylated-DNA-[protein]-cysteine methyltransferase
MTVITEEQHAAGTVPEAAWWDAIATRDTSFDGLFYVAVTSTGVYCRPSCPARRPRAENIRFFSDCESAEAAGFRPCRRCEPRLTTTGEGPEIVRQACALLEDAEGEETSVEAVSRQAGVRPQTLRRLFKRTLGLTPKQYAEAKRVERLRAGLKSGGSVTEALYDAGYSSSSRLYEAASERLGMTPGEYRKGAPGRVIRYRTADSPLGRLLVAATQRGVCFVRLGESDAELGAALRAEFPEASLEADRETLLEWTDAIVEHLAGVRLRLDLPLDIQATAFQWRVWRALQAIGYGETRSYSEVARAIGARQAARAVARACATNPVPLVIPCHRVVRAGGGLGGYGMGVWRKRRLLEKERDRAS